MSAVSTIEIFAIVSDYIVGLLVDNHIVSINPEIGLLIHVILSSVLTFGLVVGAFNMLGRFVSLHRVDDILLRLVAILTSVSFVIMYIDITYQRFLGEPASLEQMNALFFIIYVALLLVVIVILFVITKRNMENKLRQKQLLNMQDYIDQLEQDYQDLRKFRHDYKNILVSIEDYILDGDLDGLSTYYTKYIRKTKQQLNGNIFNLTELKNLKDHVAKSIISSKLTSAQSQGIESSFEEKEVVGNFSIDPIEFVRILGILLDNGIEAAKDSKHKMLRVAVIKEKKSNLIFIGNSYAGSLPPLFKLKQAGFSTKGEKRGLGLANVADLVGEMPNVTLETRVDKDMFVQILSIRKDGVVTK